jgi:hypothetical protein
MTTPTDLLGWQETRWGMTSAEIEAAMAGTRLEKLAGVKKLADYKDRPYHPNGYKVFIANTEFVVRFVMQSDGNGNEILSLVELKHKLYETVKMSEVNLIKKVISERYGPPSRSGTSERLFWRFPTTTISFWYLAGADGVVYIDFQPTGNFVEDESAF